MHKRTHPQNTSERLATVSDHREELTEKDTASGKARARGVATKTRPGGGPDAREDFTGGDGGDCLTSFQSQLRLGPSHTGNCGGWKRPFGWDRPRRKEAEGTGRRHSAGSGTARGVSGARASAGRKRPAHHARSGRNQRASSNAGPSAGSCSRTECEPFAHASRTSNQVRVLSQVVTKWQRFPGILLGIPSPNLE